MAIEAQLADGRILEFPDGTDPNVIQATVKKMINKNDGLPITPPPVSRGTTGMDNAAMSSTPIDQDYVPDWAIKNPRLYGGLGALKEVVSPFIETGALIGGGILGAGGGPLTSVAGAGVGYGLGKEVTGMADQFLGNVPQKSLVDELRETAYNVGEGAAYEMGGQAIIPLAKLGGKGLKGASDASGLTKYVLNPIYNTLAAPINATKNVFEGLYKGGREKIIGRTMDEAAGPNANQIIKTLRENKTLNPESKVSAGEVATPVGSAEFSALNVAANKATPTAAKAREKASNEAVINELRIIGKDKPTLDSAVKNRKEITDPMYVDAGKSTEIIDVTNVAKSIDKSIAISPKQEKYVAILTKARESLANNFPVTERAKEVLLGLKEALGKRTSSADRELLKKTQKIMKEVKNGRMDADDAIDALKGIKGTSKTADEAIMFATTRMKDADFVLADNAIDLISASKNIANLIKTKDPSLTGNGPGASLDNFIVKELSKIKTLLDNTISNKVPAYKKAQEEYKKLSIPIDQMRIGQTLESKLVPPAKDIGVDAKLNAAAYAKALRDDKKTVGAATDFKRNEGMGGVLTPEQMGITQRVGEEVARRANYLDLAQRGAPRTGQIIGDQMAGTQLPNALNRPIMIINNILDRLQGKVQGRSLEEMAIIMQDPQKTAILLQSATQPEKNEINKLIQSQFFNKIPTQPSTVTLQQANELQKLNSGPPFTQEQLQY
tara:strand:+ start:1112 stop:3286 length:2175 start_codon:yes stop_codon:yes gene_type:complete